MQLEKVELMKDIDLNLNEFEYDLPEERIAQYPVSERDMSKLLYYNNGKISQDIFRNIEDLIPVDSLLVFNNTSVIRARILFKKETGTTIEVFCLEPLLPEVYDNAFKSDSPVEWKCIIGNLKKWKSGIIKKNFEHNGQQFELSAEKIRTESETCSIRFCWNCIEMSFGDVLENTGHVPLPPYLNRDEEEQDSIRYQTVYSKVKGSVAAPTAGLHFTKKSFDRLNKKGIRSAELTLHIGAGTFQPVKSENISDHLMHCEHFVVTERTLEMLIENIGKIIPVGTTSVRAIESLYWLGIKILSEPKESDKKLTLDQWEAYSLDSMISSRDALEALLEALKKRKKSIIEASTSIMIVPGYNFKMTNGMITNFHQPRSTLLLLISAWVGKDWKNIYRFALENNFRFLSYGDCSLLIR
jgi:S-adenosylmethionine:tRNA ribosyltransferase-isomerase